MIVKKEIEQLKKEIKILKESVRILECRSIGVDPYGHRNAYDLSKGGYQ
jgi:hypothetical protein